MVILIARNGRDPLALCGNLLPIMAGCAIDALSIKTVTPLVYRYESFGMTELTNDLIANSALIDERYELRQFVGQGNMGAVYRAHDKELGRTVALKCILNVSRQNAREFAIKEARTLASLSHPNIVQVYDVLSIDEQVWIVTEWLEGRTLESGDLPINPTAVAAIMTQLFAALSAAHQAGIYHRDIKPSNLMILKTGRLVLLDFGVAFAPGESSGQTMAGSLRYTDPRILEGIPPDAWSDLFSAALVQLELMTGEKVLPDLAPLPLYRHITDHLNERVATLCDGLYPPLVETAIMLCKRPTLQNSNNAGAFAHSLAVKALATLRSLTPLSPEMYLSEWLTNREQYDAAARELLTEIATAAAQNAALSPTEKTRWIAYCMQNQYQFPDKKMKTTRSGSTNSATAKSRYDSMYVDRLRRNLMFGAPVIAGLVIIWTHILNNDAPPPLATSASMTSAHDTDGGTQQGTPIFVSANAWADVSIDGVIVGRLPTAEAFVVAPGKRNLRLESPYIEPLDVEIDVIKGQENKFRFNLKPKVTLVELQLNATGELFIDGTSHGIVRSRELPLTMGKHEVWVKRQNRIVARKELTIGPDSSRQIKVE